MQLVREFRVNSLVAVSEAFSALPGRVAGVTVTALQANLTNSLVIKWGDVGNFRTFTPAWVPAGFNGGGYSFGGPCDGEIFGFDWGPGADVYLGTIRFWDEPIRPYGCAPVLCDFSSTLAAAATSAVVTGTLRGAWISAWQLMYLASQASTPVFRVFDGTVASPTFSPVGTPAAGETAFIGKPQTAIGENVSFKTTNNGAVNMTYFLRVLGFCGGF